MRAYDVTSKEDGCHFDNSIEFFYNHATSFISYGMGRAFS